MSTGFIKDNKLTKEIPLVDVKYTHSLSIGQTGSGKTTSFIYPNLSYRLKLGHGILFFDIKGSEHKAVKVLAKEQNRLKDIVEIGKPWGEDINVIEELNDRSYSSLLTNLIGDPRNGGQNAYFYSGAIALGMGIFSILRLYSVISKEIKELDVEVEFELFENFSFEDIFKIARNIDTLYTFIQKSKKFIENIYDFLFINGDIYDTDKKNIYKNIALNYTQLKQQISNLKKYDVPYDERRDKEKFDSSLISIVNSLNEGFSFMVSASSKYISNKENPFDIVKALQNSKIVIINVRVIPDNILELLLEQIFDKLIDLNLIKEENRHPTSIFIDEAQRLINKNIPLDVLRSSKVDVVLAVQSELQLVSKFNSYEDWKQISVNISDKFAFRSSLFTNDNLSNFYMDTSNLNTFEYIKEHENKVKEAIPKFIDNAQLESVEYIYQNEILKLDGLSNNEIYSYDVTHFEKEREVKVYNIKTKQQFYKKLFTKKQDEIIDEVIKDFIKISLDKLIKKLNSKIEPKDWDILYHKLNIYNPLRYEESFYKSFNDRLELYLEVFEEEEIEIYLNEEVKLADLASSMELNGIFEDPKEYEIKLKLRDDIFELLDIKLNSMGLYIAKDESYYYLFNNKYAQKSLDEYEIMDDLIKYKIDENPPY